MSFPKIRVFINSDENLKSGGIPAEKVPPALYDMMLVCKSCNATINNEQIITTRHDDDAFDGANRPVLGTKSSKQLYTAFPWSVKRPISPKNVISLQKSILTEIGLSSLNLYPSLHR